VWAVVAWRDEFRLEYQVTDRMQTVCKTVCSIQLRYHNFHYRLMINWLIDWLMMGQTDGWSDTRLEFIQSHLTDCNLYFIFMPFYLVYNHTVYVFLCFLTLIVLTVFCRSANKRICYVMLRQRQSMRTHARERGNVVFSRGTAFTRRWRRRCRLRSTQLTFNI